MAPAGCKGRNRSEEVWTKRPYQTNTGEQAGSGGTQGRGLVGPTSPSHSHRPRNMRALESAPAGRLVLLISPSFRTVCCFYPCLHCPAPNPGVQIILALGWYRFRGPALSGLFPHPSASRDPKHNSRSPSSCSWGSPSNAPKPKALFLPDPGCSSSQVNSLLIYQTQPTCATRKPPNIHTPLCFQVPTQCALLHHKPPRERAFLGFLPSPRGRAHS